MIPVGIAGATGYVGAELVRLLLNHKNANIAALSSVSHEGEAIDSIYKNLKKSISLNYSSVDEVIEKSRVVFAALPHGISEDIAEKCMARGGICIDMGADFRLDSEEEYRKWYGKGFDKPHLHDISVYGLPEINRERIRHARIIGNPGCYPTGIILALMPALKEKIIDVRSIIIDSKSGVTGAGKSPTSSTHFPECNESISPYKVGEHRHIPEIEQELGSIAGENINITFVPHLLPVNRGILSTIYCGLNEDMGINEIYDIYSSYYGNESFIRVMGLNSTANIKNVKYSNYCDISIHKDSRTGRLILISAIDNMVKGSAGQAIQNMNIALGFDEGEGLGYIPPAF